MNNNNISTLDRRRQDMADPKETKVVAPVVLEPKPDVVVNTNLSDLLRKKEEEFNKLAGQLRNIDDQIKKTNEGLQAERNKSYTAAVEIQGTIRFLQSQIAAQEKPAEKK